jgi:hypothetical protein
VADRKEQPAVLRRKVERLQALLEAEQKRSQTAFDAYRTALYELTEANLKLSRIEAALKGDE